jgi:hypothetical protein
MVTGSPLQIFPSSGVVPDISVTSTDTVGGVFTVIVTELVLVQLLASVTVTVYEVVVVGETLIADVMSPVLHSTVG